MEGLAKELFEQATIMNEASRIHGILGRQQMAREVMAWVNRVGLEKFGEVPIGELVALCQKEITRG